MSCKLYSWCKTLGLPALLSYLVCSVLFTYPLILNLATHVPGLAIEGDVAVAIWNLWWTEKALQAGISPLFTDYIFYPYGVSLVFHGMVLSKALLSTLLQPTFTPWTVYNLLILATFATAGFTMYHLARYLTGSSAAAWVAGLIYGFSPYMLARGLGHLNYLSSEWLPVYILCLLRLAHEGRRRWAVGAGFFLLLTAYCEYYYVIYLTLFTVLFLAYLIWQEPATIWNRPFLLNFALMGGIAAVGFSPVLTALFSGKETGFVFSGWSGSGKYGADLLAFFTPPPGGLLFGDWTQDLFSKFTGGNATEATVFTGYTVLILAGWAVLRRRAEIGVRLWLAVTLIFFVLALGPLLHIGGNFVFGLGPIRFAIPLPYILIHYLPLIKGARVPARFDIMVSLGLAVLSAYGLSGWLKRPLRTWNVAVGIFLLISLEYLRLPYPLSPVEIPEVYHTIAQDKRDVTVLEIPLGWGTGWGTTGRLQGAQQVHQIVHEKRLVSGFASRVSQNKLERMQALPLAEDVLALQNQVKIPTADSHRESIREQLQELLDHMPNLLVNYINRDASVSNFLNPPDNQQAVSSNPLPNPEQARKKGRELVQKANLAYVIVHPPYSQHRSLVHYLETALPLVQFYNQDNILGYRIETPNPVSPSGAAE